MVTGTWVYLPAAAPSSELVRRRTSHCLRVKGNRSALNYVFILSRMDIAANTVISLMFNRFKRSFPPRKIKMPDWNLSLVLWSLTHLPFEPMKLSLNKHPSCKTCSLLSLASGKQVSELHGLSYRVCHSEGWRFCTFLFLPNSTAKTLNPIVYDKLLEAFSVPSLADFVDDRDEMLLCPIRALKKYLSRMEQFRPKCFAFFTF